MKIDHVLSLWTDIQDFISLLSKEDIFNYGDCINYVVCHAIE